MKRVSYALLAAGYRLRTVLTPICRIIAAENTHRAMYSRITGMSSAEENINKRNLDRGLEGARKRTSRKEYIGHECDAICRQE